MAGDRSEHRPKFSVRACERPASMEPLDPRSRASRSCYEELDGLMLVPRTIYTLRGRLAGGDPGVHFINGKISNTSSTSMMMPTAGACSDRERDRRDCRPNARRASPLRSFDRRSNQNRTVGALERS
jgi:hypothetical protein